MTKSVVTDGVLHAILTGPTLLRAVERVGDDLRAALTPAAQESALELAKTVEEDPAWRHADEVIAELYRFCPGNLAERLVEALVLFRLYATSVYPPLVRVGHRLAEAELALYTKLGAGKPYRDHLAHSMRNAALASLFLFPDEIGGHSDYRSSPLAALSFSSCIEEDWHKTKEFGLLKTFTLRRGLPCPDPETINGVKDWRRIVAGAIVMASLVHDLGYAHKAVSEKLDKIHALGDTLSFRPVVSVPANLSTLPLAGFFNEMFRDHHPGTGHDVCVFLERYHQKVHSLVGALYLATVPDRVPAEYAPWADAHEESACLARGRFELTCHLASMLAFGHDLALRRKDEEKDERAQLGLANRAESKELDAMNLKDFPFTTVYALCDVLQEFGRPIRVVSRFHRQDVVRWVVPVAGIRLSWAGEDVGAKLEYLTDTSTWTHKLITGTAKWIRAWSGWDQARVGMGVHEWLDRAGLNHCITVAKVDPKSETNEAVGKPDASDPSHYPPAVRE